MPKNDFYNKEVEFGSLKLGESFLANDTIWVKTAARVLEGGIYTNAKTLDPTKPVFITDFLGVDKVRIHSISQDKL